MNALREQIAEATSWLEREAQRVYFGEVGIALVIHGGRITRIERSVVEKTQASGDQVGAEKRQ